MEVSAIPDLPEIRPGDDLGGLISDRAELRSSDVVCVASTVVSKAEGRLADLDAFPPSERALAVADRLTELTGEERDPRFAQAIIEESEELIIEAPFVLAATRFGHITVNAGIDRSNVAGHDLLLLPEDPTASARALASALGCKVIVTDTSGRPFRLGQRGVALGWAGLAAARDWRGEPDRDGRRLDVTVQAVVDELAATANLLTGEGDGGTPVAVIRGFEFGPHETSDELFRGADRDVIRSALRAYQWTPANTTHHDRDASRSE
jgi:coenzyme F420-0:L-glutamate ligase/coenzyme F420-1:gamma-L-glutamate ligase